MKDIINSVWESFAGRVALLCLAAGWVPFALLGCAQRALTGE